MKLFSFFFIRALLIFILTFIGFSQIRLRFFKHYKKKSTGTRDFYLTIFASYLAVLAFFLFTPNSVIANHGIDLSSQYFDFVGNFKDRISSGAWGVNFIPFKTMKSYIKYSGFFHIFSNILGNILIFMPYGFLLPLLYKKAQSVSAIFRYSISLSIFIEFIQFFIGRSVDIDDVILNTLGGIVGYLIFRRRKGRIKSLAI